MIFAGIVAGGSGTRMKNAPMPKQFLKVGGQPILVRTIKAFYDISEIECIYIGINADWYDYTAELLKSCGFDSERVFLIKGGADRNGTVMNILSAVKGRYGVNKGDVLVTHDGVRPFVSGKMIRDNISCAQKKYACGTYIPSEDTIIIKSADGVTVSQNLVRSELYRAQTPQSFEISKLCECIERLGEDKLGELTDTCGIFTACGLPIYIVEGEPTNFKITTEYDLKVARLLCQGAALPDEDC